MIVDTDEVSVQYRAWKHIQLAISKTKLLLRQVYNLKVQP